MSWKKKFVRNWGRLGMKCKLSDICDFRKGKVDVSNLTLKTYISTENMLPNKGGITVASYLPTVQLTQEYKKGDVLVSNIRPYFKKIWRAKNDGGCSNDVLVFQGNSNIDGDFLYYILANDDFFAYSMATSKGTKMPRGDKTSIMQYEVPIFDIDTQRKIASVLRSLDEKIELNSAINNNLQQQIQTLFADWILTNRQSATEVALSEVCIKVTDGSHFSPKDDPASSIPMLSVKDMREFDFDFTSCKHICEEDYEKMVANDCVPQVNDILVAKDGSYLKEIFICNEQRKIAILSSIAIFRPDTTIIHPEILLAFFKSPHVLREVRDNYVSGSALPRIVLKDFKKLTFALPNMDVQNQIAPLFASVREQIAVNVAENKYLAQLRDTLLSKLMSGEISVDSIRL